MQKKKIVTIGGGTGSYTLLTGIKGYSYDISAIVTMADDGGSTGILRDELGVLPPGDVRQCLVALSDSTEMLRDLMSYRFEQGGLKGHSFGNLFLSALEKITGSFSQGVAEAGKILNVRGRVYPVSESNMRLKITLENGDVLDGEKELDDNEDIRDYGIHEVSLVGRTVANKKAVAAIAEANYIIIGPGDHFGSVIPNLLVRGIARAIKKSQAQVMFVSPLTNKVGHTGNFDVADYVGAIEKHIGKGRVGYVFYNTKAPVKKILDRYEAKEGAHALVLFNEAAAMDRSYKVVKGDYLRKESVASDKGDAIAHTRAFIRHDSRKLASAISFVVDHGASKGIDII